MTIDRLPPDPEVPSPSPNSPPARDESDRSSRSLSSGFRELIDALPIAVYATDIAGHLTYFNAAARRLAGRDLAPGRDPHSAGLRLLRPDGTPAPLCQSLPNQALPHQASPEPGPSEGITRTDFGGPGEELLIERPDGTRTWVEAIPKPLRDEAGEIVGQIHMLVDIGEWKRNEEANARLAAIVASSDDAIISKDLDGVIMSWNRGAERLFGYTAAEAIGQPVTTLLIPEDRQHEEPSILERIRRGEPIDHYETVRRRKDGSRLDISLTVSPLVNSHGVIVGASKIARDITARKQAEEALREVDRRKNEFLATLAHELRNPLAPIRNSLHVLRLSGPDAAIVTHVQEVMERQVTHMVRLVDDLLDVSRINTGKIELRPEPIEIAAVALNAIETSRPLIEAGRHTLTTNLSVEPLTVEGDPVRLAQVVSNLLNNAARYTPPGGRIRLEIRREGGEAVISVRDTGIGIPPAMLDRVFEMFTQVHRENPHSHGGLGIGLALASLLVGLHGGRIEARSEGEGKGAEFLIRLPLRLPPPRDRADETPRDEASLPAARIRILIVDDNQDAASSLATLLRILGGEVRTANDGPTALSLLDGFRPALILLDLGMPRMDGYEVAHRIRQRPDLKGVTLVALTGWGQEEDRRKTHEAGFDEHLTKPVHLEALETVLSRLQP